MLAFFDLTRNVLPSINKDYRKDEQVLVHQVVYNFFPYIPTSDEVIDHIENLLPLNKNPLLVVNNIILYNSEMQIKNEIPLFKVTRRGSKMVFMFNPDHKDNQDMKVPSWSTCNDISCLGLALPRFAIYCLRNIRSHIEKGTIKIGIPFHKDLITDFSDYLFFQPNFFQKEKFIDNVIWHISHDHAQWIKEVEQDTYIVKE